MKKAESVEAYIAEAPKELQSKLASLRETIKKCAPTAEERISYGMPYYAYKGRLAYFAAFKNHIGLFLPPPITTEYKKELQMYETAKGTIRFPHERALPLPLIKKLIKARMKKNDERIKLSR